MQVQGEDDIEEANLAAGNQFEVSLFFPIIWNLNQYNDDSRSNINKYKLILDLKKGKLT